MSWHLDRRRIHVHIGVPAVSTGLNRFPASVAAVGMPHTQPLSVTVTLHVHTHVHVPHAGGRRGSGDDRCHGQGSQRSRRSTIPHSKRGVVSRQRRSHMHGLFKEIWVRLTFHHAEPHPSALHSWHTWGKANACVLTLRIAYALDASLLPLNCLLSCTSSNHKAPNPPLE